MSGKTRLVLEHVRREIGLRAQRHDVVYDDVDHEVHATVVQRGGEVLQVGLGAEVLVERVLVDGPVAVRVRRMNGGVT